MVLGCSSWWKLYNNNLVKNQDVFWLNRCKGDGNGKYTTENSHLEPEISHPICSKENHLNHTCLSLGSKCCFFRVFFRVVQMTLKSNEVDQLWNEHLSGMNITFPPPHVLKRGTKKWVEHTVRVSQIQIIPICCGETWANITLYISVKRISVLVERVCWRNIYRSHRVITKFSDYIRTWHHSDDRLSITKEEFRVPLRWLFQGKYWSWILPWNPQRGSRGS